MKDCAIKTNKSSCFPPLSKGEYKGDLIFYDLSDSRCGDKGHYGSYPPLHLSLCTPPEVYLVEL